MKAHIFLDFIFLVITEKDELYILSLEGVTSIKIPINALKVVYHPVSCLLHHYIGIKTIEHVKKQTMFQRKRENFKGKQP